MLVVKLILVGLAALTQAAPAQPTTDVSISPQTNITDSSIPHDLTRRTYPIRCNNVEIKLEDFHHTFEDIQNQMRQFVQNGERLCTVTESKPKRLAHWGSSYVTLRVFEASEMWVECDQVLKALQDLWIQCGSRGGSMQTYWEHVVVHHTNFWV